MKTPILFPEPTENLGMVAYTCHPSAREKETGGSQKDHWLVSLAE